MARSHDGLAKLKAAREAKASATMAFRTYDEARAALPANAQWQCCFGYPGEGGFKEHFDTEEARWTIDNGTWSATKPFTWTVTAKDFK